MPLPSPQNPLARDTDRAMIGGVCAGIARWAGWDPTLVRVLYVVGSLVSVAFPGTIVYVLHWIVMPAGRRWE